MVGMSGRVFERAAVHATRVNDAQCGRMIRQLCTNHAAKRLPNRLLPKPLYSTFKGCAMLLVNGMRSAKRGETAFYKVIYSRAEWLLFRQRFQRGYCGKERSTIARLQ
jgi:hypothetical protein